MVNQLFVIFSTLLSFFLLLFIYTKVAGPIPFYINSVTTTKTDTFQVSGTGKVSTKPDTAFISVGITAQGATVKATQETINQTINKVSDSIKDLGIPASDIQTTNYNISPTYDYTGPSQRITGYTASTNLNIKVKELDKANSVIDGATKAGANSVGGINFDVDDKTAVENEARVKAIAEAKQKAELAAKTAGFTLGRMINYSESRGGSPGPIPYALEARGAADIKSTPTSVEPGTQEITLTVTLSFEIR